MTWKARELFCLNLFMGANCRSFFYLLRKSLPYSLCGCIGKVVASHAEGCKIARSNPDCG